MLSGWPSISPLYLVLKRTRIGLLIRAGVENREMVEALGYRIDRLFVGVFMVGSALAALGGAMWAGYETLITPALGGEMMIVVFIVVIIGGLGSVEGTLLGAIMVGLMANYIGFLAPKLGACLEYDPDDGHPDVAAQRPQTGREMRSAR